MLYRDDPTNIMTEWDRNAPSCEYCKGTGWMPAFGVEVKCNHHTWFASLWLRYKSGRLAHDEELPPEWLFKRMGESYPKKE
jgi:hypothetical protein